MQVKKKDNVFILLSLGLFTQMVVEFLLLKNLKLPWLLKFLNYGHLIEISIIAGLMYYYVKKFYTESNKYEAMKNSHQIISDTSSDYYFQQLYHNSIVGGVFGLLLILIYNYESSLAFFSGYIISSILGYIGIKVANVMNIRMANTAIHQDKRETENVGIYGGLIMGTLLLVPLMGISICPFILKNHLTFSFGAAIAAILTRLTGGFFTKSADIAADMVGKLDYGLDEDDVRNPAVLADNIGDIVGDCIGSIQSLFAITCFILKIFFVVNNYTPLIKFHSLSFMIGIFIFSMMISSGMFFVTCNKRSLEQRTLLFLSINFITLIVGILFFKNIFFSFCGSNFNFKTFFIGMISVIINGLTVYFFTAPINKTWNGMEFPILELASYTRLGAGINVLKGMSLGKICTFIVLIEVIILNIINLWLTNFVWFGLEFALGVLSFAPFIMVIDNFGPVADNSGGLLEAVEDKTVSEPARKLNDTMDQYGNMTKAISKVYTYILLAAILYQCFTEKTIVLNFLDILGALVGALLIIIFNGSSMAIALSITCNITNLIKKMFDDNPKILTGEETPDHRFLIKRLTSQVLEKSHWPFYITTLINTLFILIFFGMFKQNPILINNWTNNNLMDNASNFLTSSVCLLQFTMAITGIIWGLYESIAGAAWDNCKKLIESGVYGGKRSPTHNNAIIGDTVGDLFKDNNGTAVAPLILVSYCLSEILCNHLQRIFWQ